MNGSPKHPLSHFKVGIFFFVKPSQLAPCWSHHHLADDSLCVWFISDQRQVSLDVGICETACFAPWKIERNKAMPGQTQWVDMESACFPSVVAKEVEALQLTCQYLLWHHLELLRGIPLFCGLEVFYLSFKNICSWQQFCIHAWICAKPSTMGFEAMNLFPWCHCNY